MLNANQAITAEDADDLFRQKTSSGTERIVVTASGGCGTYAMGPEHLPTAAT